MTKFGFFLLKTFEFDLQLSSDRISQLLLGKRPLVIHNIFNSGSDNGPRTAKVRHPNVFIFVTEVRYYDCFYNCSYGKGQF